MSEARFDLWLLLDAQVHFEAYRTLSERGIQAIHVGEEGIAGESARTLLELAIEDDCILVTGNYADFSRLAEAYRSRGRSFPGILFLPADPEHADAASQAAAIEAWLETGHGEEREEKGERPLRDRCEWLG